MSKQENSVKIMGKWVDAAQKRLNEDQLKEFCYRVVMYGLYQIDIECEDAIVDAILTMIYPQIDEMQEKYGDILKVKEEQNDFYTERDIWIWGLAHNEGLKMGAIKERYDEKYGGHTSIDTLYKTQGWKQRMKDCPTFMDKIEENAKLENETATVAELENENDSAKLESVAKNVAEWQLF